MGRILVSACGVRSDNKLLPLRVNAFLYVLVDMQESIECVLDC